jgi:hypothetical protein
MSDGQFGDESVDYIPAGVNATPSWTRWSNVSVSKGEEVKRVKTHLKNLTLLFFG